MNCERLGNRRDGTSLSSARCLGSVPVLEPRGPSPNESSPSPEPRRRLTGQKDEVTPGHVLGEEVPACRTETQRLERQARCACRTARAPPGSPFSMKVSARTQTPLTATTKSATDVP